MIVAHTFLGFNVHSTSLDNVVARFNNPIKIEKYNNDTRMTFNREGYNFIIDVNNNGYIDQMEAAGVSRYPSYRGVHLGYNFKEMYKKMNNPLSYDIVNDNKNSVYQWQINYQDCSFVFNNLGDNYVITKIVVHI